MPMNPYEKYKQQSVMTMTQGEMLQKLYDEIIKQLSTAEIYMEQKDIPKTNAALQKAQKILTHLNATLNFQYEVSNSLSLLYEYFSRLIVDANIKKSADPIREIIPMVEELRETFMKADKLSRGQKLAN